MSTPHAITRAKERYGLDLTENDLWDIAKRVKDGDSVLVGKQTDASEVHMVKVNGIIVRCVVSKGRERIITFLPVNTRPSAIHYGTKKPSREERKKLRRLRKRAA